jgi:hypothetical protein
LLIAAGKLLSGITVLGYANTDDEYNTAGYEGTNAVAGLRYLVSRDTCVHIYPATFVLGLGFADTEASMTKMMRVGFVVFVLTLFSTFPLAAQTTPASPLPRQGVPATTTHKSPCWQQVGLSHSAMQQRRQIEESTHSQVESVCSDSSLTPQQKQQKIHQLHAQAQQQMGGLMTPQQEQALKSCRERQGEAPHMGGGHGAGPCGEMAAGNKP